MSEVSGQIPEVSGVLHVVRPPQPAALATAQQARLPAHLVPVPFPVALHVPDQLLVFLGCPGAFLQAGVLLLLCPLRPEPPATSTARHHSKAPQSPLPRAAAALRSPRSMSWAGPCVPASPLSLLPFFFSRVRFGGRRGERARQGK